MGEELAAANRGREEQLVVREGYAEYAPPVDLAPHVSCFWTNLLPELLVRAVPAEHRVLPDGCVDIVIGFGRAELPATGRALEISEAMAVGSMTRPLVITGDRARSYVGVRFKPGRAFAAFGIPAAELTDDTVEYDDLFRGGDGELDALLGDSTNAARLESLVRLVRRRLFGTAAVPPVVRAAVRAVAAAQGNVRVEKLAGEIGVTRQQLARQFATHVGVTPKMFARVMRTQAALAIARADAARAAYPRQVDWGAIAYGLGYYDQAHFIDEFKAMTGVTPGRWPGL